MKRKILAAAVIVVLIIGLALSPVFFSEPRNILARLSGGIYMRINHGDHSYTYISGETVPQINGYIVRYADEDGNGCHLSICPYRYPLFVLFDSLNPGG
jgi:hypothetical protein